MLLRDYREQDTGGIRLLSNALCDEAVKSGLLVKLSHRNISVGGGTVHLYFQRATAEALRSIAEDGNEIIINTGLRTLAQQYVLKRNLTSLVAPIGRSDHGAGRSVDIQNWEELAPALRNKGFRQPYRGDEVHWDYPGIDSRENTVKAFQTYWNKHNPNDPLDVDGIVGDGVMKALGNTPIIGWPNFTLVEIRKVFIDRSYHHPEVAAFQELYNKTSTTGFLKVDGQVGQNTLAAYKKYVWSDQA
jgi:hypothetical protein